MKGNDPADKAGQTEGDWHQNCNLSLVKTGYIKGVANI